MYYFFIEKNKKIINYCFSKISDNIYYLYLNFPTTLKILT